MGVVTRSPPPPGVEPGGVWGTHKYLGGTSGAVACLGCLCFGLPALLVLLCPLDKRDAYKVNNRIYDPEGRYLGKATSKFVAKMDRWQLKKTGCYRSEFCVVGKIRGSV